jgi:hypothetical protein
LPVAAFFVRVSKLPHWSSLIAVNNSNIDGAPFCSVEAAAGVSQPSPAGCGDFLGEAKLPLWFSHGKGNNSLLVPL